MKIAIIDDDEVFRNILMKSLQRRSHEVVATDAYNALQICREFLPTAVLLDLKMSGISGLDLIPQIRSEHPAARIVILTGYGSIPTAIEAVKLGCSDYLMKPVDASQIEAALQGRAPDTEISIPSLGRVEWEHLQRVLSDCNNNISQAARLLGIDRRSLQRKLAKYPPKE